MYSIDIKRSNSKTKLSNFVNGVSEETFTLLLAFILIGVLILLTLPQLIDNHRRAVAYNEWNKKNAVQPFAFTAGMPVNTRRLSLDSPQ